MRQIITFNKEINLKDQISSIVSISIDHEERIASSEINGDFIIKGEYKTHDDTTEITPFQYRIPYNMILPESIKEETINVDIDNFTYDIKNNNLIVNIDYIVNGEEQEREIIEPLKVIETEPIEIIKTENEKEITNVSNETVIYHIHIVKDNEKIEDIVKLYETNIETVKEYNDISKLSIGDKLIIPDKLYD